MARAVLVALLVVAAACSAAVSVSAQLVNCVSPDGKYNLSAIAGTDLSGTDNSYYYKLHPCGVTTEPTCAQNGGSFCQYTQQNFYAHVIAKWDSSGQWSDCPAQVCPNGGVTVSYANGDKCNGSGPNRAVTFNINCPAQGQPSSTAYTMGTSGCVYTVTMTHAVGCGGSAPPNPPAPANCKSGSYDLTSIAGTDLPGTDGTYNYKLQVCGLTSETACAANGGSFCQYSQQNAFSHVLAKWDSSGVWSACSTGTCPNGGFQVAFADGDKCNGSGPNRAVTFFFKCPANGQPSSTAYTIGTSGCVYTVTMTHSVGCVLPPTPAAPDWYECPLFTSYKAGLSPTAAAAAVRAGLNAQSRARNVVAETNLAAKRAAEEQRIVDEALSALQAGAHSHKYGKPVLGLHANARQPGGTAAENDFAAGAQAPWAECALIKSPLFHTQPSGPQIEVFVKRLRFNPQNSALAPKSIIFYQGGPGGSSEVLENVMYAFNQYSSVGVPIDVYTMDHRGVGRSTRLSCERSQAETAGSQGGNSIVDEELPQCGEELRNYTTLARAGAFTPDQAAGDINWVLTALPGTDWYVYGVSYGTMLVQRYLALYPLQAKAVILDGVVTLSGGPGRRLTFDYWSVGQTEVGGVYFGTYCKNDAYCNGQFGATDVWQTARLVMDSIWPVDGSTGTHCQALLNYGLTRDAFKGLLGALIVNIHLRHLVAASIYRARRCSDNDVQFFEGFSALFNGAPGTCPVLLDSDMIHALISGSELYDARRPYSELQAQEAIQYVGSSSSALGMWDQVYEYGFPRYTPNPATYNVTLTGLPVQPAMVNVLLFNGDLDAQTPIKYAEATKYDLQAYGQAAAEMVTIPGAPHGTILYSAYTGDANNLPCTMRIIMSYMKTNAGTDGDVDLSCTTKLTPVDFHGAAAVNTAMFGTADAWDGQAFPPPQPNGGNCSQPMNADTGDMVKKSTLVGAVVPLVLVAGISTAAAVYLFARRPRSGGITSDDKAGYALHP